MDHVEPFDAERPESCSRVQEVESQRVKIPEVEVLCGVLRGAVRLSELFAPGKPDGFYLLSANDAVDPNPQIRVHDTGSSFVAGPYHDGTKIKLAQAPGATPGTKPGPGVIDWKITLNGDASVTATDSSGNTTTVSCKVSPPPK